VLGSLEALVEALDAANAKPVLQTAFVTPRPDGPLTAAKVCQAVGSILPEGTILSDEAITSAAALPASTAGAPRHDWLTLTGGAIGQGLPVAVGAAIACPDRPVIALEADGSALYTIQSLWTMVREQLNVTVVIFNNRAYGILDAELARLEGQSVGDKARDLLNLRDPDLDFVRLGTGLGIPSRRVDTAEQIIAALDQALADPGPHLIEAILPGPARPRR
jgi:acetolactate synthase-1/2/3 large subunit